MSFKSKRSKNWVTTKHSPPNSTIIRRGINDYREEYESLSHILNSFIANTFGDEFSYQKLSHYLGLENYAETYEGNLEKEFSKVLDRKATFDTTMANFIYDEIRESIKLSRSVFLYFVSQVKSDELVKLPLTDSKILKESRKYRLELESSPTLETLSKSKQISPPYLDVVRGLESTINHPFYIKFLSSLQDKFDPEETMDTYKFLDKVSSVIQTNWALNQNHGEIFGKTRITPLTLMGFVPKPPTISLEYFVEQLTNLVYGKENLENSNQRHEFYNEAIKFYGNVKGIDFKTPHEEGIFFSS